MSVPIFVINKQCFFILCDTNIHLQTFIRYKHKAFLALEYTALAMELSEICGLLLLNTAVYTFICSKVTVCVSRSYIVYNVIIIYNFVPSRCCKLRVL